MRCWRKSKRPQPALPDFHSGREPLGLKLDLHVHTFYSPDSLIKPEELIFYAKKNGLDGVAITDHDTIHGASRIAGKTDLLIIPGIEISTLKGHVVGLNVNQWVPPKLGVPETLDRIHEAGGIAVACHPITIFRERLKRNITSQFDAIEVINSSAFPFHYSVKRSQKIASQLGIPGIAGSDAHYAPEIGYGYTIVDAQAEIDDILKAIKDGSCSPHGTSTPLMMRLKRETLVLKKKLG